MKKEKSKIKLAFKAVRLVGVTHPAWWVNELAEQNEVVVNIVANRAKYQGCYRALKSLYSELEIPVGQTSPKYIDTLRYTLEQVTDFVRICCHEADDIAFYCVIEGIYRVYIGHDYYLGYYWITDEFSGVIHRNRSHKTIQSNDVLNSLPFKTEGAVLKQVQPPDLEIRLNVR